LPAPALSGVSTGGFMKSRDAPFGARHAGDVVNVVFVVLVSEPFRRKVGDLAVVVMAGHEQRGRIESEPARRTKVWHDARYNLGRSIPEGLQVEAPAREFGEAIPRSLRSIRPHRSMLGRFASKRNTNFLVSTFAPFAPRLLA